MVTVFEPDTERNGYEFDYAEGLLSNPDNIELDIRRRRPEGSATREKHPNTSNESPSDNSIPQTPEKVNRKNSISETFPDDFPIRSDLGADIYGKDVALEFPIRKDIVGNNVEGAEKAWDNSGERGSANRCPSPFVLIVVL